MKFLVIGDYCRDKFIYGNVNRLCPEAPVPVINPMEITENDGMAGNVYNNLKNLDKDIEVDFITSESQSEKIRFVDYRSGYILLRVDNENPQNPVSLENLSVILSKDYDCVIVSDYNKGFLNEEAINMVASKSRISFLDTKKILGKWAENISFIKINEKEYDFNLKNNATFKKEKLIVTLGERGTFYNEKIYPTQKIQVVNECGCGDTYLASLAYHYTKNKNIEQAIEMANYFAGLACSKRGVVSQF